MKAVDKIIDVLVTVIWQYLRRKQQIDEFCGVDDSEWFEGTREEYEKYLEKNHLTEDDVFLIEIADELTFD